jgi:small redox-active disulfide protein 2
MEIKVCGPGCANCTKAENIVREAVAAAGVDAEILKISDFAEMAKLGVLSTPAIVINGQIKCVGKVPAKNEVLAWLKEKNC